MQDVNGSVLLGFSLFEILVGEGDVFILFVLETFDNILGRYFLAAFGADLFVFDPAPVFFAKLVEMDVVVLGSGVKTDRDMHKPKRNRPSVGNCHNITSAIVFPMAGGSSGGRCSRHNPTGKVTQISVKWPDEHVFRSQI